MQWICPPGAPLITAEGKLQPPPIVSESDPPLSSARSGLFPGTSWTVVRSLAGQEPAFRILAWDEFCSAYWKPLFAWLRHRGVPHHHAEDLVQGFFAKLHASPVAVEQLHPEKGRLRSYLLVSLKNFWTDHLRSSKNPATRAADEPDLDPRVAPDADSTVLFDREWALSLLAKSVEILRAEYVARGNAVLFDALLPLVENDDAPARERASDITGLAGNTFNVAIKRLRERLAARLRAEVAATLLGADDEEIDDELRHLVTILGRGGFGDTLARADAS